MFACLSPVQRLETSPAFFLLACKRHMLHLTLLDSVQDGEKSSCLAREEIGDPWNYPVTAFQLNFVDLYFRWEVGSIWVR